MGRAVDIIKGSLTMRDIFAKYGFEQNRAGFIVCPFHSEKTASLGTYANDKRWKCFGCGAGGDVISFVMKLFGLNFSQAVIRLGADFGFTDDEKTDTRAMAAQRRAQSAKELEELAAYCALPGFVDSKNEEKTERNAGYLVVSHSGGGMLRQGTRKGIRRTPANRGMRAHWVVKGLDISEDVCHGMCP